MDSGSAVPRLDPLKARKNGQLLPFASPTDSKLSPASRIIRQRKSGKLYPK